MAKRGALAAAKRKREADQRKLQRRAERAEARAQDREEDLGEPTIEEEHE